MSSFHKLSGCYVRGSTCDVYLQLGCNDEIQRAIGWVVATFCSKDMKTMLETSHEYEINCEERESIGKPLL
jgi:hypothetical protein